MRARSSSLALQDLASQAIEAPLVALQFVALPLRVAVQLVELLARRHHLGQGRRRGPAPLGAAQPLLDLPLQEPGGVPQHSCRRQCRPGVRRRRLACGASQGLGSYSYPVGHGGRLPGLGRADPKDRGGRARTTRGRESEEQAARPAAVVGGAPGGHHPGRENLRTAAAELDSDVGRTNRGAEGFAVLPARDEGHGRQVRVGRGRRGALHARP